MQLHSQVLNPKKQPEPLIFHDVVPKRQPWSWPEPLHALGHLRLQSTEQPPSACQQCRNESQLRFSRIEGAPAPVPVGTALAMARRLATRARGKVGCIVTDDVDEDIDDVCGFRR